MSISISVFQNQVQYFKFSISKSSSIFQNQVQYFNIKFRISISSSVFQNQIQYFKFSISKSSSVFQYQVQYFNIHVSISKLSLSISRSVLQNSVKLLFLFSRFVHSVGFAVFPSSLVLPLCKHREAGVICLSFASITERPQ